RAGLRLICPKSPSLKETIMPRPVAFHSPFKKRPSRGRLIVEQLEDRLPPGDVIGLSGATLWGLGLAGFGRDPFAAPIGITDASQVRQAAEMPTASPVRPLSSTDTAVATDVGIALGSGETPRVQAIAASIPEVSHSSTDQTLFDPGLGTELEVL